MRLIRSLATSVGYRNDVTNGCLGVEKSGVAFGDLLGMLAQPQTSAFASARPSADIAKDPMLPAKLDFGKALVQAGDESKTPGQGQRLLAQEAGDRPLPSPAKNGVRERSGAPSRRRPPQQALPEPSFATTSAQEAAGTAPERMLVQPSGPTFLAASESNPTPSAAETGGGRPIESPPPDGQHKRETTWAQPDAAPRPVLAAEGESWMPAGAQAPAVGGVSGTTSSGESIGIPMSLISDAELGTAGDAVPGPGVTLFQAAAVAGCESAELPAVAKANPPTSPRVFSSAPSIAATAATLHTPDASPLGTRSASEDPGSGAVAPPGWPVAADWTVGLNPSFSAGDSPGPERGRGESSDRESGSQAAAAKKRLAGDPPASQPASVKGDDAVPPSKPAARATAAEAASQQISASVAANGGQPAGAAETGANIAQLVSPPNSSQKDAADARPVPSGGEELPQEPAAAAQPPPSAVPGARVVERIGQAELRVGVNTAAFGNVEVRTAVTENRVAASVVTAHNELRAAMMAEVPSLQQAMEQRQLRLERFDLNPQTGGQNSGPGAEQQPKPSGGLRAELRSHGISEPAPVEEASLPAAWPASAAINVHA